MHSDSQTVVAIDPGGTIGVAVLSNFPIDNPGLKPVPDSGDVYYKVWMDKNPVEVWNELYVLGYCSPYFGPVNYVVESFVGSGPRTTESTHTIKQIGYFYYSCIQYHI